MAQKALTIYTPVGVDPHISAQDDAFIRRSIQRCESGILGQLKCAVVNNNTVCLSEGGASNRGYILWIPDGDTLDLTINTGTQGLGRYDLVVAEFVKGGGDTADELSFKVVVGTPSVTPSDPDIVTSSMLRTGDINQIALFRVKLDGININSVERVAPYANGSADMGVISVDGAIGTKAGLMICTKDNGVLSAIGESDARKLIGLPSFKTYYINKSNNDSSINYVKNNWRAGTFDTVGNFFVYVNGGIYGPCDSFICSRTNDSNGAVLQFGYALTAPVYHILNMGTWTSRTMSFV